MMLAPPPRHVCRDSTGVASSREAPWIPSLFPASRLTRSCWDCVAELRISITLTTAPVRGRTGPVHPDRPASSPAPGSHAVRPWPVQPLREAGVSWLAPVLSWGRGGHTESHRDEARPRTGLAVSGQASECTEGGRQTGPGLSWAAGALYQLCGRGE